MYLIVLHINFEQMTVKLSYMPTTPVRLYVLSLLIQIQTTA